MNPKDLFRFAMKQDLQRTDAHADNLRTRMASCAVAALYAHARRSNAASVAA